MASFERAEVMVGAEEGEDRLAGGDKYCTNAGKVPMKASYRRSARSIYALHCASCFCTLISLRTPPPIIHHHHHPDDTFINNAAHSTFARDTFIISFLFTYLMLDTCTNHNGINKLGCLAFPPLAHSLRPQSLTCCVSL